MQCVIVFSETCLLPLNLSFASSDTATTFPSLLNIFAIIFSAGLGLEFVRQLLSRPGSVVATCRNPSTATELQQLQDQNQNRLQIIQLDTSNEESIQAAASHVSELHSHLNLLLNVSGVLHISGVMTPETALNRVTLENLQRVFSVNAFGPILVCKAFSPLLINAGKHATE